MEIATLLTRRRTPLKTINPVSDRDVFATDNFYYEEISNLP